MSYIDTDQIIRQAGRHQQRTGQYLFNHLPSGAANVIAGKLFDPFHKDLTAQQLNEWVDNHLIFQQGHVVGVFDQDELLWYRTEPINWEEEVMA